MPKTAQTEKYDPDKDPDYIEFTKTVPFSSDAVSMILRCHLLAEFYLDRLILIEIPRGDIIVDGRFQFSEKLTIVDSLNVLDKNLIEALRKLNTLRNNCSHVLNYEITQVDIDKIGFTIGKDYLVDKETAQGNTNRILYLVLIAIMSRISGTTDHLVATKTKLLKKQAS